MIRLAYHKNVLFQTFSVVRHLQKIVEHTHYDNYFKLRTQCFRSPSIFTTETALIRMDIISVASLLVVVTKQNKKTCETTSYMLTFGRRIQCV